MGLAKKIANAIISALVGAVSKLLDAAWSWIATAMGAVFEPLYSALEVMVYVPAPTPDGGVLFGRPTNAPWGTLYDVYWGEMVPLAYTVLVVAYLVNQSMATFGIGSAAAAGRRQRGVLQGAFAIPAAWYLVAALLRLLQAVTFSLTPDMSAFSRTLISVVTGLDLSGGLAIVGAALLLYSVGSTVLLIALLVHVVRIVAIMVLVIAVPLLLAFDFGEVPYLGSLSRKLLGMLPKLALAALPTALGLRVTNAVLGSGGVGIQGLPIGALGVIAAPLFALTPAIIGLIFPYLVIAESVASSDLASAGMSAASAGIGGAIGAASGGSGSSGGNDDGTTNSETGSAGDGGPSPSSAGDGTGSGDGTASRSRTPSGATATDGGSATVTAAGSDPDGGASSPGGDAPPTDEPGPAGGPAPDGASGSPGDPAPAGTSTATASTGGNGSTSGGSGAGSASPSGTASGGGQTRTSRNGGGQSDGSGATPDRMDQSIGAAAAVGVGTVTGAAARAAGLSGGSAFGLGTVAGGAAREYVKNSVAQFSANHGVGNALGTATGTLKNAAPVIGEQSGNDQSSLFGTGSNHSQDSKQTNFDESPTSTPSLTDVKQSNSGV